MRLFLYYSLHTTWNQFKKMFKTWIFLIFLAAIFGGGLMGLSLSRLSNYSSLTAGTDFELPANIADFLSFNALTKSNMFELAISFVIIGIFALQIITAEKSVSRLFLPADVNFLFASDRTPQENLSFRIMSTLGTAIVALIYIFFQLPSLVKKFDISLFSAGSFLFAWCATVIFGMLFKIIIYQVSSRNRVVKNNIRFFFFSFAGILFTCFYLYYKSFDDPALLPSLYNFFDAPWTKYIPVYGWIKGAVASAIDGDIITSLIFTGLSIILIVILWFVIQKMPSDYYEEATKRCEELALYMDAVQSENATLVVMRPQKRDEDVERDGFKFGKGASVYFYKTVYNRFRFSRLKFITKTLITYLIVTIMTGLFSKLVMDKPSVYAPVLVMTGFVFFRTVLNPVGEDIKRDAFRLSPDSAWRKLFYSLLGGTVNCLFDSFIPLMAGAWITGNNPFLGLVFLPLVLSVDVFATIVGIFVEISLPSSVDKTFRQVLQVLILYFGLIPDEIIIVVGIIRDNPVFGFTFAILLNLIFASVFFGLSGVILEPVSGNMPKIVPNKYLSDSVSKLSPEKSPEKVLDDFKLDKSLDLKTSENEPKISVENNSSETESVIGKSENQPNIIPKDNLTIENKLNVIENENSDSEKKIINPEYIEYKNLSKSAKKDFSKIGFALVAMLLVTSALQAALSRISLVLFPDSSTAYTLMTYAPIYFIGAPLFFLIVSTIKSEKRNFKLRLSSRQIAYIFPICFFLMYLGNIIGILIVSFIHNILNFSLPDLVAYGEINEVLQTVFLVIFAPIIEELIFRKTLIDKTIKYGEKTALIMSAFLFAFFHGNIQQFCYAFLLGLVFGTIYIKTNRVENSILFHMTINFMGSVIASAIASLIFKLPPTNFEDLSLATIFGNTQLMIVILYVAFLIIMSIAGLVFFSYQFKSLRFTPYKIDEKVIFGNPGMICLLYSVLCLFIYSLRT